MSIFRLWRPSGDLPSRSFCPRRPSCVLSDLLATFQADLSVTGDLLATLQADCSVQDNLMATLQDDLPDQNDLLASL